MRSLTNALVKAKNFIPNVQGKRRFEQCLKIGMMSMRTDKSDDKCENDENAPLRLRRLTHTQERAAIQFGTIWGEGEVR